MTELKALVDHAAGQGDRWLFIALLVIGLIAIWMLGKYFTKRVDSTEAKLDTLNGYVRGELASIILKNTTALEAHTRVVQRFQDQNDPRRP